MNLGVFVSYVSAMAMVTVVTRSIIMEIREWKMVKIPRPEDILNSPEPKVTVAFRLKNGWCHVVAPLSKIKFVPGPETLGRQFAGGKIEIMSPEYRSYKLFAEKRLTMKSSRGPSG